MPLFGLASREKLATCDEKLQKLFNEIILDWDCIVLQGKRSETEEQIHLADGTSHTHNSKHVYPIDGPSLAVDVAPYPVDWKNLKRFYAFGGFVLGVASQMGIIIRWGGDWDSDRDLDDQKFNDLPHFELVNEKITSAAPIVNS